MTTPHNITFEATHFDINGKLKVVEDISANANVIIGGDLEVGGNTELDGNVKCNGDLTIVNNSGQNVNVLDTMNEILDRLTAIEGRLTNLENNLGY